MEKKIKTCTSKEWDNCQEEKRGCNGCYYFKYTPKDELIKIVKEEEKEEKE